MKQKRATNIANALAAKFSKENVVAELKRFFPIFVWLPRYNWRDDLRYDIIAGITVGLTMVPQCLAYAQMCNVRGEFGLYSAFAGQVFYIFMGTSKDASVGPSAISSMLSGQANAAANPIWETGDPTACAIISLFSGIILLSMGILKLGFIVNLFSIPVVSGFTSAAGFSIAASQIKSFFGLKKNPFEAPGAFVKQIVNVFQNSDQINWKDVAFGVSAAGFLLFMQYLPLMIDLTVKRWFPLNNERRRANYARFTEVLKLVVASRNVILFLVATGTAYGLWLSQGPQLGVTLVGDIKPGLPSLAVPNFDLVLVKTTVLNGTSDDGDNTTEIITERVVVREARVLLSDLIVAYIVVPLLGAMELFAITKALGRKNGYRVDARQELLAIGISNIVHAFLNGVPVTAAVTRCALNDQCRVRTQVGSIVSTIIVLIAISSLTGTFYYIPKATLAAIIMVAALNLVDFQIIPDMWRRCRSDCVLLVFTFLICVLFEISYGVLFCLFLNMVMFLKAVSRMQLQVTHNQLTASNLSHPASTIAIVRLSHGMKYPSADKFLDKVNAILVKESHAIVDCTFVKSVDYTGIQALRSLLLSAVQRGLHIMFTNMNDKVKKQMEALGLEQFRIIDSVEEAVAEYNKALILSSLEEAAMKMTTIPEDQVVTTNSEDLLRRGSNEANDAISEGARRRLIRRLSVQPSFYAEIPFAVGGDVNLPGDDDDDHEEEIEGKSPSRHRGGLTMSDGNVQFMSRLLLRELSKNSDKSRSSREGSLTGSVPNHLLKRPSQISKLATSDILDRASNSNEIWDAIATISASPALKVIDTLSNLSEFSHRPYSSNPIEFNISL